MGTRAELQILLELTSGVDAYFQAPSTNKMIYPCVLYHRDSGKTIFADDKPYLHRIQYVVMVIDRNPDSEIPEKIAMLPMCIFNRFYTADQLNHNVYKLFF